MGEVQYHETPDEAVTYYYENAMNFLRDLFDSSSLKSVRADQKVDGIKTFIIDGKDIILSNLSNANDAALFEDWADLTILLVQMQKQYYGNEETGEMDKGILSGLEFVYSKFVFFVLATRAKGELRERMIITNPAHMQNLYARQPNKEGGLSSWFGGKKQGTAPQQY